MRQFLNTLLNIRVSLNLVPRSLRSLGTRLSVSVGGMCVGRWVAYVRVCVCTWEVGESRWGKCGGGGGMGVGFSDYLMNVC